MATISVPAFEIKQGGISLFVFVISPKTLWENVMINTRDPDKETGYQRTLSPSRVQSISNYVDAKNIIPNSLLIALDEDSTWIDGVLTIPDRPDAGWVIDGQHRLAGAHEAEQDLEMSVIAIIGASLDDQVRQFVTINREAKGVPTSLYLDLRNHLPTKKTPSDQAKDRAADIAQELKKDEDSIFFGRIVLSAPKRGQVSLTNFVRKVAPHLLEGKGSFPEYTFEEQKGIFENYFKAFKLVFPKLFYQDKMIFFKTLGFGALLNALPTVFVQTRNKKDGFSVEDIAEILRAIDYFPFDSWENAGSGNAAEMQAGNDLRTELLSSLEKTGNKGSLRLK